MAVMTDHAVDFVDVLHATAKALAEGNRSAALGAIAKIAFTRPEPSGRPEPPLRTFALVFARDHFQCRYCGVRTIPTPVMRVVSSVFPEEFPYHPNWKASATHPAISMCSTSLDHLEPVARGGDPLALGNLVTACWVCNLKKGDRTIAELGWELRSHGAVDPQWDGLTRVYPHLWRAAGEPAPRDYHQSWIRAFALSRVTPGCES